MRTALTVALVMACACGPDDFPEAPVVGQRYLLELAAFEQPGVASGALTTVGPAGVLEAEKAALLRDVPGLVVVDALEQLPMLVVTVRDAQSLASLRAHPQVAHLWEDSTYAMNDAESFPFIGQPQAAAAGAQGSGTTVAVLDTGLDYRKADFGTCDAGVTGCKVAFTRDFAPDDGQLDDNGHGTNVAGIVLGVAPKARVVGLDVFTGAGAAASNIVSAINWVIANKATYNIVAMNLSLGGGSFTGPCATDVFATPIASARAAGVLAAIASGNAALTNAVSAPACAPEALSVGAVYDAAGGGVGYGLCTDATRAADKVACFSNSASFLSLLAPGAFVTAAGSTMSGTSQATPHVAGAIAVLAAKYPTDTPSTRASRLLSGAPAVRDARNGVTRPRLFLGANPGACSIKVSPETAAAPANGGPLTFAVTASAAGCTWSTTALPAWMTASATSGTGSGSFKLTLPANTGAARSATLQVAGVVLKVSQAADTTPPTGTVTLPALSRTATATATLSATDPSGVNAMCLSFTASCSTWVAYATSVSVTLPAGDGAKKLSVWFRDTRGNAMAAPVTASTKLDATAPTNGAATATVTATSMRLAWSGFTDATSGIARYRVVQSTTTADAPASCGSGTVLLEGTALTVTVAAPTKTMRRFRVCAIDAAGNISTGATVTATTL